MKKGTIVLIVVILIAVIAVFSVMGSYNGLIEEQAEVEAAYANISTQLQRRADLIPNLVNTVKGYASHEEEIFTAISDARARLSGASGVEELEAANAQLESALSRLLVVVENYPDLKANQNFIALSDELAGTENRISVARKDYNEEVRDYNTDIRKFPKSILAGIFGFEKADYFEADEESKNAPEVNFD